MTVFKTVFLYHLNDNAVFKAILIGTFSTQSSSYYNKLV